MTTLPVAQGLDANGRTIEAYGPSVVTSAILQNNANGTVDGTDFDITGSATVQILVVPTSSYTGTVTFKASPDGTNFDVIQGNQQGTSTLATSVVCSSGTITIWNFQTSGLKKFRCSIGTDSTSGHTVTVTGYASNVPNSSPLAATITSTVLGAGSNIIGKAKIVDTGGTNVLAVDSNNNLAASMRVGTTPVPAGHGVAATALRVELPSDGTGVVGLNAGTNLIGGANIVDAAGTNKAGVDAQHNVQVTDGGTATVVITASSAGAVKAAPGRLCRVLTTSAATAAVNIYDNTNAASGTIIATVPASTAVGTVFSPQMPAAVGIYVGGGAGTPGLTVSYS